MNLLLFTKILSYLIICLSINLSTFYLFIYLSIYLSICLSILRDEDIEGDFDPAEYDKRMAEIFENYDNTGNDDEKPEFSDLEVKKTNCKDNKRLLNTSAKSV